MFYKQLALDESTARFDIRLLKNIYLRAYASSLFVLVCFCSLRESFFVDPLEKVKAVHLLVNVD